MTEPELIEMAYRAVAADLDKMLFDRPDVTARVGSNSESRFVHAWIANTVKDLQDRLATLADDRGITIEAVRR